MNVFRWLPLLLAAVQLTAPAVAADFDGKVQWARRVSLGTPVSGVVRSVEVEIGDTVQRGKVMLALDPTPFEAEVAEFEGRVSRTTAELEEQRKALERAQELFDREVLSTVELDHARLAFSRAEGEHREAVAGLRGARYRLENSEIRAPFDGVVVDRDAEVGQTVVATLQAPSLLSLAEVGRYRALTQVSLDMAARLSAGAGATVKIGDARYDGRIQSVGFEPAPGGVGGEARFEVAVDFAAAGVVLRPGTPATMTLP